MISILLPSRGRPGNIARLCDSLEATTIGGYEVIVRLDDDDESLPLYPARDEVTYLIGVRTTLSAYWNECHAIADGPIYCHAGDDITFNTFAWDELVIQAFPDDGIAFVHGDDLGGKGELLGTHGFLRDEWIEAVGTFVPPYFASDFNDLWLNDVADALGRRVFCDIITEHHHPAFGKGPMDATHLERIERHKAEDCDAIYARTAPERAEWVDKLRVLMRPDIELHP